MKTSKATRIDTLRKRIAAMQAEIAELQRIRARFPVRCTVATCSAALAEGGSKYWIVRTVGGRFGIQGPRGPLLRDYPTAKAAFEAVLRQEAHDSSHA